MCSGLAHWGATALAVRLHARHVLLVTRVRPLLRTLNQLVLQEVSALDLNLLAQCVPLDLRVRVQLLISLTNASLELTQRAAKRPVIFVRLAIIALPRRVRLSCRV